MANGCPVPNGVLVIIGGKENKGEDAPTNKETPKAFQRLDILKKFIEQTDKEQPVIEIITSATSEPEETFEDYCKAFKELEVQTVGHIHHNNRGEAASNDVLDRINAADGVFFAGGDQLKYTSRYGGTQLLTRLKERYIDEKLVVGGTSAGAMALSTPMIYAGSEKVQDLGGEIKITTGLEFLKDVCIDTHFSNRARFVRMAQVIVTNPTCIGIGIGEDTAIIVRNGIEAEVAGSGLVFIIDGFHISDTNVDDFLKKKLVSIRDLKVHLLSEGDTYKIPQNNPPHQ